jgi:hypothetical protein
MVSVQTYSTCASNARGLKIQGCRGSSTQHFTRIRLSCNPPVSVAQVSCLANRARSSVRDMVGVERAVCDQPRAKHRLELEDHSSTLIMGYKKVP